MIKGKLGLLIVGAGAVLLVEPVNGKTRRSTLKRWAQQLNKRVQPSSTPADLGTTGSIVSPDRWQGLQNLAHSVQDKVESASATVAEGVAATRDQLTSTFLEGSTPNPEDTVPIADSQAPLTAEAYQAIVAPTTVPDPIPEGETNDPTLLSRVESELFRDQTLPKGKLSIDAANGVVTIRGSLDDDQLSTDIVERVRAIEGVASVRDLLRRG